MIFCAAFCYAEQNLYRSGEDCVAQYLKGKGKLPATFQSTISPSSARNCRLVIALSMEMLNTNIKYQVGEEFPNEVDCLTDEFENKESIDYFFQLDLIKSSRVLSVSAKNTQFEETRDQLKDVLEEIAIQCLVDGKKYVKIFNETLDIKNKTLAAYQSDYCMAKYALVDNQLLELSGIDINPHHIDTKIVNCEYIIDVERSQSEKDLIDIVSAEIDQRSLDCVMNEYRSGNMFNWRVALKALSTLDVAVQDKERETTRIAAKITEFGLAIIACKKG